MKNGLCGMWTKDRAPVEGASWPSTATENAGADDLQQDSSDLAHLARIASMSGTGAFESRPLVILGNSPSHKNQECARTPSESAVRLGRIANRAFDASSSSPGHKDDIPAI